MSILGEFKAFILKGNVVDLAVGVVIGASFKSVVDSVVGDLITPLIALITKRQDGSAAPDFAAWAISGIKYGNFINVVISFLILAAVVFFLVVKPMNHLMERMKRKAETQPDAAPLPEDVKLLMEIRDLMKAGQRPSPPAAQPL